MKESAVSTQRLTLSYADVPVVEDVTFSIPTGTIVGIVGPNGAGKSTLLKALVGSMKPDHGEVSLFGKSVDEGRELLTYVPQRGEVDWDFPITAGEVVAQGCFQRLGLLGRFRSDDREAVKAAMEAVDIVDLADRQIGALSGGQKQRVFLARALAQGGELFIMDEPFAGVDAATESAIIEVLQHLRDEGKTVVVVHHDLMTVRDYFDHLVLLNRKLIASGPTGDVFTAENLRETYGGRIAILAGGDDGKMAI